MTTEQQAIDICAHMGITASDRDFHDWVMRIRNALDRESSLKRIINTLQQMNDKFGKGGIVNVAFNMGESKPEQDEWYGTVNNQCMFKVVGGYCTFLSRKRKVQ